MFRKLAWRKNSIREIKHTWERYIAIMAIITLGVGFFSGLKVTRAAMVKNLDDYLNEYQMYDYQLISTLGLTGDDEQFFDMQNGITAQGAVSVDFITDIGEADNQVVLKAHSITDSVNILNVLEGRMPQSGKECVLDARFFSGDIIGTKISPSAENDEDTLEGFAYKEYTVVGLVDSPIYLNYDRGTTKLANGSIHAFVYIPKDGFSLDYFTEINIRLESEGEVYSAEYKNAIERNEIQIKEDLETRAKLRYLEIVTDANEALADAQKEYDDGYSEYLSQKADANKELDDAWDKLLDANNTIIENEKELNDAQTKIADAQKEYQKGLKSYEDGLSEFVSQSSEINLTLSSKQQQIDTNRKTVESAINEIEKSGVISKYAQIKEAIFQLEYAISLIKDTSSVEYIDTKEQLDQVKAAALEIEATGVITQYATLQDSLFELDEGQKKLDIAKEEAKLQLSVAEDEINEAKAKLDSALKEIEDNKQIIIDGLDALEEGKIEYKKGLKEYKDAKKEADEGFAEAEEELNDARIQIADAKAEIEDIPEPNTFALNRNYNIGYINFDNDSSIVDGIAEVLPIFFFLVAALVCTTTMTRMVDEQRTQIGTLKALGYSNGTITGKYIAYSGSAAMFGCVIGYILGTKFFPMAIWEAYSMLYKFSSIEYLFDIELAIISLIVSLLCSAGVTYISCKSELVQMPASLIRPKAPKAGKRIMLERIPFVWNKVSFLHKVSIRNILRYKRRLFMTVAGIAGCTALIVGALGIRDSIRNVADNQFDSIMVFDYDISFSENQSKEDRDNFIKLYEDDLSECVFICTEEIEATRGDVLKKATVVATDDSNINKVISLHLNEVEVAYPSFGAVSISNSLAREFKVQPGDTISINIGPTETAVAYVEAVFENYVGNYILMTGRTYSELFGQEPEYKNAYASTQNKDIYAVSALLLNEDSITSVRVNNDTRIMVNNMMMSLDAIIWLVIACAGALSFVVIYNLNNINITERNREIATLKVLGFYQNEVGAYVFRETITLTFIGAILGMGLGKLLHMFVMGEITVEMVYFKEQIFPVSYFIAFVFTFAITFIVNWMLRRKIDVINMAESLKSVE